jgi:hypothetical protein
MGPVALAVVRLIGPLHLHTKRPKLEYRGSGHGRRAPGGLSSLAREGRRGWSPGGGTWGNLSNSIRLIDLALSHPAKFLRQLNDSEALC